MDSERNWISKYRDTNDFKMVSLSEDDCYSDNDILLKSNGKHMGNIAILRSFSGAICYHTK